MTPEVERPGADREALTDRAWALIREALESGTMTLGNGESRILTVSQLSRLVQWLASQAKTPYHELMLPETFLLQKTERPRAPSP